MDLCLLRRLMTKTKRVDRLRPVDTAFAKIQTMKGLILAQNERWRRGLGMLVERESSLRGVSKVAKG